MNSKLRKLIERAETWPQPAQDDLLQMALEIEAEQQGHYHASAAELGAIDEALEQVTRGEIAPQRDVEAAFDKLRHG